jgi:adenylate cyclase
VSDEPQRLTARELAAAAGSDPDLVVRLRQASGLPEPGPDVAVYETADVDALHALEELSLLFGEAVALQLMRVSGAALGRIAEAAVAAYMVNVHAPLQAVRASDVATEAAFAQFSQAVPTLSRALDAQLRHHVEAAITHYVLTRTGQVGSELVDVCIVFTDLVGSTAWSRSLSPAAHAEAISRFSSTANDVALEHGGRLVKLIGDEAMFVTADPKAGCAIALDLAARCGRDDDVPDLRGGVARGAVVARDGDYHGAVVSLASRLVRQAEPGRVLVTRDVAATLSAGFHTVSFGARWLRGFDEPVEVLEIGLRSAA